MEAEFRNREVHQRPGRRGVLSRERHPCQAWVWRQGLTGSTRRELAVARTWSRLGLMTEARENGGAR